MFFISRYNFSIFRLGNVSFVIISTMLHNIIVNLSSNVYTLPLILLLTVSFLFYIIVGVIFRNHVSPLASSSSSSRRPKVVIIGGGFAGLTLCRTLAKDKMVDLTLVNSSDYIEYIPGILRALLYPSLLSNLQTPLTNLFAREYPQQTFLQGEIQQIMHDSETCTGTILVQTDRRYYGHANRTDSHAGTNHLNRSTRSSTSLSSSASTFATDGIRTIPYDILVLSTGSSYPAPIKGNPTIDNIVTIQDRIEQIQKASVEIDRSRSILIVGGGPVGVELAGELVSKYCPHGKPEQTKHITLVTAGKQLLEGFDPILAKAAYDWLTARNVTIHTNLRLPSFQPHGSYPMVVPTSSTIPNPSPALPMVYPGYQPIDTRIKTSDPNIIIPAEYVFACIGSRPSSSFLQHSNGNLVSTYLPSGKISVDDSFQLRSHDGQVFPRIFALGDVSAPFFREADVAYVAEKHALCVVKNIQQYIHGYRANTAVKTVSLFQYPKDIPGTLSSAQIFCISLGPYYALLAFNKLSLGTNAFTQKGIGLIKRLIEFTKVSQLRNHWFGYCFWLIADWGAEITSHYLFPPPPVLSNPHHPQHLITTH